MADGTVSPFKNTSYSLVILTVPQLKVLSYIDISTASLSIFGAGSVVIMALLRGSFAKPDIHPIFNLSLADLFASISLVISAIFFTAHEQQTLCDVTSMLTSTFYVCTFLLTIGYAIQVYLGLRRQRITTYSFHQSHRDVSFCDKHLFVFLLYISCWALPLLVCIVLIIRAALDKSLYQTKVHGCSSCLPLFHYREDKCWGLNQDDSKTLRLVLRMGFLIPLVGVLIGNTFIYYLLYRGYQASHRAQGVIGGEEHHRMKVIRNRALVFQGVFFVCWMPSLILGLISLSPSFSMSTYYPIYIIQAMTAPLQGFLNSLIYAWQRKTFVSSVTLESPVHRNFAMNGHQDYRTFESSST